MTEWKARPRDPVDGPARKAPKTLARDPETGMPLEDSDLILAEQEAPDEDDLIHIREVRNPDDYGQLSYGVMRDAFNKGVDVFATDYDFRLDEPPSTETALAKMSLEAQAAERLRVEMQIKRSEVFSELREQLHKEVCLDNRSNSSSCLNTP
jgi:hypothetical protein